MAGLRRVDILCLKLYSIRDDGIHILLNKTKPSSEERLIIERDR